MTHTPITVWRKQKKHENVFGVKGKIISWTIIRVAPKSFATQAPYPVVLVEIDKGKRILGQLVDYTEKDLVLQREVIAVLRRLPVEKESDVLPYGTKFKPT